MLKTPANTNQVEMSLKQDAKVLMMLASMKVESEASIANLPVVCEFHDVFLYDIEDFPPEREVEFVKDLIPSIIPISMGRVDARIGIERA